MSDDEQVPEEPRTSQPDRAPSAVPRSLAFWCTLLVALVVMSPIVALLIVLPSTGPTEARTLMEPLLEDWNYTATLGLGGLLAIAGYDKWQRGPSDPSESS